MKDLEVQPSDTSCDEVIEDCIAQAVAAIGSGDPETAEAIVRRGLASAGGGQARLIFVLAWVLQEAGRQAEAEFEYRRVIALNPSHASAQHNLGNALRSLDRPDEAIAAYRRAIALEPEHSQAYNGLALAYRAAGALDRAIAAHERQLERTPDDRHARVNLAVSLLLAGDFEGGWAAYEARRNTIPGGEPSGEPWDGRALDGRSILLYAEQGFGDTIQFLRYATALKARGGRVLLKVQPPLVRLCRAIPGTDHVIAFGEDEPAHDCQARLMSLPFLFGSKLGSIPDQVPYLSAEPARVAAWRARLAGPPGLKVGIVWHSKPRLPPDLVRRIPLAAFARLARVPGVRLISLQKQHGLEQLADWPSDLPLEDLAPELDQGPDGFLDTAAVMDSLDLVITADTAIPHLAGALGRPVWLLLKRVPEWRWMLQREDSPWYPSMRLFRQSVAGDWTAVMERVALELAKLAGGDREVLVPRPWTGLPARSILTH